MVDPVERRGLRRSGRVCSPNSSGLAHGTAVRSYGNLRLRSCAQEAFPARTPDLRSAGWLARP
jgi:hypothetical protein